MTNKEYLTKMLSGLNISDDDIDFMIFDNSLDPDAIADPKKAKLAVYSRMTVVLKGAMQNISEGGYSISWNMEAVKMFYNSLCDQLGVENKLFDRPKIRDKSNYW